VASRVVTLITDDLDGSEAAETIASSLEGASYEIDLSNAHAEELRSVLKPYMKAGRKAGGRKDGRGRSQGAPADKDQIKAIRDWAKKQGLKVSDRGRVSADVREAYDKAH
jgi:Lsr2